MISSWIRLICFSKIISVSQILFKSCQMNWLIQAKKLLWIIMNQTDSVFEIMIQIFSNNWFIQWIKVFWMIYSWIRLIQFLNSTHWVITVWLICSSDSQNCFEWFFRESDWFSSWNELTESTLTTLIWMISLWIRLICLFKNHQWVKSFLWIGWSRSQQCFEWFIHESD